MDIFVRTFFFSYYIFKLYFGLWCRLFNSAAANFNITQYFVSKRGVPYLQETHHCHPRHHAVLTAFRGTVDGRLNGRFTVHLSLQHHAWLHSHAQQRPSQLPADYLSCSLYSQGLWHNRYVKYICELSRSVKLVFSSRSSFIRCDNFVRQISSSLYK